MRPMFRTPWTALLILGIVGAGCNQNPAPNPSDSDISDSAPPTVSAPATAAPSPSPSPEAASVTPYRVRTESTGTNHVTFTVDVNGATVGSLDANNGQSDISAFLKPGANTIKVGWTADPNMPRYGKARIVVQAERNGQWTDVVTREVRHNDAANSTTATINTTPSDTSTTPTEVTTAPVDTTSTPGSSAPEISPTPAPTPAVQDSYTLKTVFSPSAPGEFTVAINGETVAALNANGEQDIASYLKKGPNKVDISWRKTAKPESRWSTSKLVIGMQRNGAWNTVVTQEIKSAVPDGKRTITIVAR